MIVEFAVCIFDQVIEEVDWHNEKCNYHEGDE